MQIHEDRNSRLDFKRSDDFVREFRAEAFSFFRARNQTHLLEEVWAPLCAQTRTLSVIAIEERPWPPKGVGARVIRGLANAVISDDGQAVMTPGLIHPVEVANIGLAAALTKYLFEELRDRKVEFISYFVNTRSKLVSSLLSDAGFVPGAARVVFEGTEFVNFSATPATALSKLGFADIRLGDVLSLHAESSRLTQWAAFHLGLSAGLRPYWDDAIWAAEVYPGIIDWVALPPSMITGTSRPGPLDPGAGR